MKIKKTLQDILDFLDSLDFLDILDFLEHSLDFLEIKGGDGHRCNVATGTVYYISKYTRDVYIAGGVLKVFFST